MDPSMTHLRVGVGRLGDVTAHLAFDMEAQKLFAAGLLGGAVALLLASFYPFGLRHGKADLTCHGPAGPVTWWLVYPDVARQGWMYVDSASPSPVRSDPVIRTLELNSVTRDVSRLVYPSDSRRNDKLTPQGFLAYTTYSGIWVSYVGSMTGQLGDDANSVMTCATIKGEDSVSQAVAMVMAHNPRRDDRQESILLGQQFHLKGGFEAHWECLHSIQSSFYTSCYRSLHLSGVSVSARVGSASAKLGSRSVNIGSGSARVGMRQTKKPVCVGITKLLLKVGLSQPSWVLVVLPDDLQLQSFSAGLAGQRAPLVAGTADSGPAGSAAESAAEGGFRIEIGSCAHGEVPTSPSQPLFAIVGTPEVTSSHVVCAGNLLRTEGAADLLCVSHPELWLTLQQAGRTARARGRVEGGAVPCRGPAGVQTDRDRAKEQPGVTETGETAAKKKPWKQRKSTHEDCVQHQVTEEAPGQELAAEAPEQECADLCSYQNSNCPQFFAGSPWPASSYTAVGSRHSCLVCQTAAGRGEQLYAAVYNMRYRVPEYTASAITRDPAGKTYDRPDSKLWERVQMGLCPSKLHEAVEDTCDKDTRTWGVTGQDDLCPLPSEVTDMLWRYDGCGKCQSLSGDYSSCGYYFNRGHLNPNHINDQSPDVQAATFSFLNAAPQAADFNQCIWQPYECAVGLLAERVFTQAKQTGSDVRSIYVITGTRLGRGHKWLKGRAAIPDFYWKAVCYPGDEAKGVAAFAFGFYGANRNCTRVMKTLDLPGFQEWLYRGSFDPESRLFPGSACAGNVSGWTDENGDGFDAFVGKVTPECRSDDLAVRCPDPDREACQKPTKPVAAPVRPQGDAPPPPSMSRQGAEKVVPTAGDVPAAVRTGEKCDRFQVTDEAPVEQCMQRCIYNYLSWQECTTFFVGTPWPPSSYSSTNAAASCPICQTQDSRYTEVLFATRFNTELRIPEYTADAIIRAPHGLEDPRDDDGSLWNRVQLGLCSSTFHDHISKECDLPETWWWGVTKVSSRSCRLPSDMYLQECGDCQGLDDDYDGCGGYADRGHLNPNAINNRDEASREATFSFINVAPQAASFNRHVWESFEEKVRYKAEEVYKNADAAGSGHKTLYVITGTKTGPGHEWLKGRVAFPEYFWKAVCYPGDESAGLRPFGVGFYGRNVDFTEVEDMVSLALPEFDSWLYDGGNEHIFQGSICTTDVDKWYIENE
ncbi:S-methylmethionine permease mmp1 [Branchiostoma belcheri]|nr:S-methylmethionine permease mmp1 [Branchiostoma belcheri]